MRKRLRSGYTTGACAAAAAKAAAELLTGSFEHPGSVEIPFPDGSRVRFRARQCDITRDGNAAWAVIVKDAGDDPDVTNGARIRADVRFLENREDDKGEMIIIRGGAGVGTVTKPGLTVPVGGPAINPVPRLMIREAVHEALGRDASPETRRVVEVVISVADGEELARKTLNARLGIVGGISILGTTGIVKPLSAEAWTATVISSMDVAKATGSREIVLSAGRASERAHMETFHLPVEAYVMMGDYLEFSLVEAKYHRFEQVHLCAQWAKMLKIAMATPQTHVRHGALDTDRAVAFLNEQGIDTSAGKPFNTAREIFEYLGRTGTDQRLAWLKICSAARKYAQGLTGGIPVPTHLVSYDGKILLTVNDNDRTESKII